MRIDSIVEQKIHNSTYWKEHCHGINAATLCNKAADLDGIGGLYVNNRPTPFLCLVYKLGLIAPGREIIEEMLRQPYFKYLTVIAVFFIRLTYPPREVFELLEPLLADYRKVRLFSRSKPDEIIHIDEVVDMLICNDRAFDVSLPRLLSRAQLEERGLNPRESLLEESDSESDLDS